MRSALLRRKPRTFEAQREYIEGYRFPPAVTSALKEEFDPVLTDAQVGLALDGLRAWFMACQRADGKALGMPSEAVDAAWHAFILNTRSYHSFCEAAFGHYLHHTPAAAMREPIENSLRRTLDITRRYPAPQDAGGSVVPFLFAVDGLIDIGDGNIWTAETLERLRTSQGSGCGGGGCGSSCGGGCGGS